MIKFLRELFREEFELEDRRVSEQMRQHTELLGVLQQIKNSNAQILLELIKLNKTEPSVSTSLADRNEALDAVFDKTASELKAELMVEPYNEISLDSLVMSTNPLGHQWRSAQDICRWCGCRMGSMDSKVQCIYAAASVGGTRWYRKSDLQVLEERRRQKDG